MLLPSPTMLISFGAYVVVQYLVNTFVVSTVSNSFRNDSVNAMPCERACDNSHHYSEQLNPTSANAIVIVYAVRVPVSINDAISYTFVQLEYSVSWRLVVVVLSVFDHPGTDQTESIVCRYSFRYAIDPVMLHSAVSMRLWMVGYQCGTFPWCATSIAIDL